MREWTRRGLLVVASFLGTALLGEVTLHLLVVPSERSEGRVLGTELPPLRIDLRAPRRPRAGRRPTGRITRGDLSGLIREEPLIGYVPREQAVSPNGWWRSNNLGARASGDTARAVPPGQTRVLVFGDSLAQASRVRQQDAWAAVLGALRPDLEVVNLGVEGYGMGQSLLRFRALRGRIEYDVVLLTFSPQADLWRDVNTLRALAGWRSTTVMPRFALAGDALRLVASPYPSAAATWADNRHGLSPRLRAHLGRWDRLWVPALYTAPRAPWSASLLLRLLQARVATLRQGALRWRMIETTSEAMQVSARIFETMRAEAEAAGARFVLVLLPSERDIGWLRRRPTYRRRWRTMSEALASRGLVVVDLAPDLLEAPRDALDRGHDGTHHGPRANALVAERLAAALAR